ARGMNGLFGNLAGNKSIHAEAGGAINKTLPAAGHHATERGGIRALSEWLNENTALDVTFIDIPNPA
ncbi:hypothetical protein ACH54_09230, partial [Salmonella enterica subsp. enterica serovar Infantis]